MGKFFVAAVLVIFTAANALAIDTFIYGRHEVSTYGNYGPTGFVGKDGISRVIFYSRDYVTLAHIAHIYRVTVEEGSDPDTHPDNPAAPGPIAQRTLVEERSFELGVILGSRSEFYVPGAGDTIYYGPAEGIRKYIFDAALGNYRFAGFVAPAAPWYGGRPTGTLAYDKRSNIWYAGSFSFNSQPGVTSRRVWKYDGSQGPDGQWEVAFDYTSTEQKYSYHDGMEMVNGYLYLADSYGTLIYEYTTGGELRRTYLRDPVPTRGEGMDTLGMGFRALQHFWYGSSDNNILEFGGGLLELEEMNNPPVAVAGAPVTVTTDQLKGIVVEGSVTDPDGGELLCRWLQGDAVLQDWSLVAPDGSCPLFVGRLAPFPVGSYPLTIEGMDDMGATDLDHTTLTVKDLPVVSIPGMELEKTANASIVAPGEPVTYSYHIRNTGTVTLSGISVTDDNGTPYNGADDFKVGSIASLDPGATATLTAVTVPSNSSIIASLGSAGPGTFAVLSLGGDAAHPKAGINCSNGTVGGNLGIPSFGTFKNSAPCTETGDFIRGTNVSYGGPGKLQGSVFMDETGLSGLKRKVFAAAAYFASLPPTPAAQAQLPKTGEISGKVTVTGTPGFNVLNLAGLRLNGDLKLTGPAGTQFVLNISGTFDLHSGNITAGGEVGTYDAVYNITNPSAVVKTMVPTTAIGVLLAPYNAISPMDSSFFYGSIIGGYNQVITLMSGTRVMPPTPPPATVTNTAVARGSWSGGVVEAKATATVAIQ